MFMPTYASTATEHDPDRPWIVVGTRARMYRGRAQVARPAQTRRSPLKFRDAPGT